MEEYRIRSKEGIERLVNLISLSYSAMTLLPYSDEPFSGYQSASAQKTRYEIGQQIQADIILCSFGKFLETIKNCSILIKVVEDYILSGFRKFQKLQTGVWLMFPLRYCSAWKDCEAQSPFGFPLAALPAFTSTINTSDCLHSICPPSSFVGHTVQTHPVRRYAGSPQLT